MNITFAEYSIAGTPVYIKPKSEKQDRMDMVSHNPGDLSYILNRTTYSPHLSSTHTKAFPLINSDCFCSYDQQINLLLCSPSLQTSSSFPLSSIDHSLINITLNDCTFSNNRLNLPIIKEKTIDHLRLYDINQEGYLIFDTTSFSFYKINHLYIIYNSIQPITMLLISNETFSLSLRTLYIDSCYLITLNQPLSRLVLLESITLINIHQFSWYDLQQQIIHLPKLHYVYIGEDILPVTNDIFNAISCEDLSSQWRFTYRLIQTCSCKLMSFLKTIHQYENLYRCPNSNNTIDFIHDICQFNENEYKIENQTDLFCDQCLSHQCPNGTLCAETYDLHSNCLLLFKYDYQAIRNLPLTPYTKPFVFQESQEYFNINSNKTLQPNTFNSVATILIDWNQNHTENSIYDAQMFHQTFSEMLNQPWSPQIYSSTSGQSPVWKDLLLSLDKLVRNIDDSQPTFEFQSKSISTTSLRFPTGQQPSKIFGWKITNDNYITANITNSESINQNVTTRVFLNFNNNQSFTSNCITSNTTNNCTNRFSITALKSPKLFCDTNRIPQYDVISIIAPNSNQHVTFYFEQKLSSIDTLQYPINTTNTTNSTLDPFYDKLDLMILEGTCMYLNTTSMIWQTDGCLTDRQLSNSTSVMCTCEHLTMFTVFFSLTCTAPSKPLEILSWIGCVLSIIGLSVTLIMFIIISQCRRTKNSNNGISSSSHSSSSQDLRRRVMSKPRRLSMVKSMLFVLCILLILMNIFIFILTFVKAGQNLACPILAALLYYFTLTAFIWKFLFAFQQSLFITNIFKPYWSNRTLFIIYLILTFSLPICPLLIMMIKYKNATFISSTCSYCWLTREFLLYGLIIPILVIVCLNIIFYLYTMIHLCIRNRQQPGLRSTKSDHSRHMQNFKIGLFFAIIMGLSWILGFLVLIPNSYVQFFGNILFCIINTLQGFAFSIMVFCMLERKSFRKCCCFWRYKNQRKPILNSSNNNPQQAAITSNNDNDTKLKTIYNSSIHTSTTSSSDNNNHDIFDQYKNKILPTRKEEDEEEGHIYNTMTF